MTDTRKPKACASCLGSTLSPISTGFVPAEQLTSMGEIKFAIMAEAAGEQEVLAGKPLIGSTGQALADRIFRPLGLRRYDVLWDNLLRCRPYKNDFPIGDKGAKMIAHCRQWDTKIAIFDPNVIILAFHPTFALIHTNQAYSTMNAVQKALRLNAEGYRPLIGMGAHFLSTFFPQLEGGMSKWDGKHFFAEWKSQGNYGRVAYEQAIEDRQEVKQINLSKYLRQSYDFRG